MKQCPVCQSTYEDRVDFCFKDGAVLEPVEASADPTALPDPGSGKVPIADAPTQVRKKPRGRGMFARPSVADMLTASGSQVPPAGGNRVVAEDAQTTLGTSTAVDKGGVGVATSAGAAVAGATHDSFASNNEDASSIPDLSEAETFVEESEDEEDVNDVPAVDPTELPDPVSAADLPFSNPAMDAVSEGSGSEDKSWAASLEVGVSASAVDVPVPQDAVEDSDLAPPGLEPPEKTVSLDDSWFGEDSDLSDPISESPSVSEPSSDATELFPELPVQDEDDDNSDVSESSDSVSSTPIEDPGFADVLGSDEVGFDDTSWSAGGGAVRSEGNISPRMLAIGFGVLAAAVGLTIMFSADDADPLPPPPVVQVQPTVQPPPPEPSPVAPANEDMAATEADEAPEAATEASTEATDPEPAAVVAAAPTAPTGAPPDPPTPPPPAEPIVEARPPAAPSPPPAVAAAPPARTAPPAETRTAEPSSPPSVWTGAPAPEVTPPPPTAASSNPWGAPAETVSRGRLTITTDPSQAIVYINDRRIGRSPTSTEVDYGAHNVRVEKLDYRTDTRVVNVQSNEVSVPIRLASAALVGKCNLLGEPGAAVAMNGQRIGSLPLTVECSPGVHRFDIQPASGGDPFTKSVAVTFVHPGETENLFLTP